MIQKVTFSVLKFLIFFLLLLLGCVHEMGQACDMTRVGPRTTLWILFSPFFLVWDLGIEFKLPGLKWQAYLSANNPWPMSSIFIDNPCLC